MSFTQSELDEVLNTMFTPNGIMEMVYSEKDRGWHTFYRTGPSPTSYRVATAKTPAEAIRAATAALVAHRLTR